MGSGGEGAGPVGWGGPGGVQWSWAEQPLGVGSEGRWGLLKTANKAFVWEKAFSFSLSALAQVPALSVFPLQPVLRGRPGPWTLRLFFGDSAI